MKTLRLPLFVLLAALLGWSFWRDAGWLQLCAGLAVFLFGMQCLEEGLRQLAGGKLEQWLARSTGTPAKGLLFGIGGTMMLQSSTLVSLLTIAFISSGLIQLAGALAIIFGANLGATSGIWLLALAGQNLSLSPLALPLLVFGVLAGFTGPRGKAAGRIVLGVAFIFLAIDQIKAGFEAFGGNVDLSGSSDGGLAATLLFVGIGLATTLVLQSSHATLMLTLAALAGGQLELEQGLAIAIGSNVGSSVTTALVGFLGGNRAGQRVALAHALFNTVTALLALLLLLPLTWLVGVVAGLAGFGGNAMLKLALFHTLFNGLGVAVFWPWQAQLARWLERWLPDRPEPAPASAAGAGLPAAHPPLRAVHLSGPALESADAAAAAVAQELQHLGRLSLEVICLTLYLPADAVERLQPDDPLLETRSDDAPVDADALYQQRVKGVYGDLLAFMGRLEVPLDQEHQRFWSGSQVAALQLVNAVKGAKHLQKNLGRRLREDDSPLRAAYVDLRRHLFAQILALRDTSRGPRETAEWQARLDTLDREAAEYEDRFRERLFAQVRQGAIDGLQAGSLLNDQAYASRIYLNLRQVLAHTREPGSLRRLRRLAAAEAEAPDAS
ncbi:Na/Pi cotransporter family protein [Pseudoxanthomonas suwonensis]|uniref:Sodium:phosphate symporter n=1 Tax=Pseudoxanthomonas suwonensis TaxID=314722 RepID=A0A0E3UN00_9GAMM|nr:Na/Pi symporter [Pseudoxanthomonas suwonensis]AKC86751.1 sodium:phosphate symporter [Pseudoxanthomonas suwonensis]